MKAQKNVTVQDQDGNSTKPLLCDVLSNDHIGVIARNIAREHAFENEFIYNSFVDAISKGMKIARSVISKNIT
jgi:hypothetical protein